LKRSTPNSEIKVIPPEIKPILPETTSTPNPTTETTTTSTTTSTPTETTTTTPKPLFSFLIKFKKSSSNHKNGGIKKYRIGRGNRIIIEEQH
jgi:hypothetical protein